MHAGKLIRTRTLSQNTKHACTLSLSLRSLFFSRSRSHARMCHNHTCTHTTTPPSELSQKVLWYCLFPRILPLNHITQRRKVLRLLEIAPDENEFLPSYAMFVYAHTSRVSLGIKMCVIFSKTFSLHMFTWLTSCAIFVSCPPFLSLDCLHTLSY